MVTVDVKIDHDVHTVTLSPDQAARELEAFLNRVEAPSRKEWIARVTDKPVEEKADNPSGVESIPIENTPSTQQSTTQSSDPRPATSIDKPRDTDPNKTWDFGTKWM
tara:strand:+ start:3054 stop:3374 length:321 start_codon:yes stop_codon:yes gene_type:complete